MCIGIHPGQYSESFAPGDDRLYQNAKYIYKRCGLGESEEFQQHMVSEYLVPAHKNLEEALELGIPAKMYHAEKRRMVKETVKSFVGARVKGILK